MTVTAYDRLRAEGAALWWLVKGRRRAAPGATTTQVQAHVARDAHGGVHMVAAHVRKLSPREAFKLKAGELREHVAGGGEAATVAQAELDRRADKRRSETRSADAVALKERTAHLPADTSLLERQMHVQQAEAAAEPAQPARRPRKAKAEEPASTLPAWLPRPKRGGRYSKAELRSAIGTMFHSHPDVEKLVGEAKEFTAKMQAWADDHGLDRRMLPYVLTGQRYDNWARMRPDETIFANEIREGVRGRASWLNRQTDRTERYQYDPKLHEKVSTPEGLAAWWKETFEDGTAKHYRATMDWWHENRGVMDPLRDPEAVLESLRHGAARGHLVNSQQAQHVLRDIHKLDFVAREGRTPSDSETAVYDMVHREHGHVTVAAARAKAAQHAADRQSRDQAWGAKLQATAAQVAQVMDNLRGRGLKPHHVPNLRKHLPDVKAEVVAAYGGKGKRYVRMQGGPFEGTGGWYIGPERDTDAEAWAAAEEHFKAIAAAEPGKLRDEYRDMRKARRLAALAHLRALVEAGA